MTMWIILYVELVEETKTVKKKKMLSEYIADAEIQDAKYQTVDKDRSLRKLQSNVVATGAKPVGSRARRRCCNP